MYKSRSQTQFFLTQPVYSTVHPPHPHPTPQTEWESSEKYLPTECRITPPQTLHVHHASPPAPMSHVPKEYVRRSLIFLRIRCFIINTIFLHLPSTVSSRHHGVCDVKAWRQGPAAVRRVSTECCVILFNKLFSDSLYTKANSLQCDNRSKNASHRENTPWNILAELMIICQSLPSSLFWHYIFSYHLFLFSQTCSMSDWPSHYTLPLSCHRLLILPSPYVSVTASHLVLISPTSCRRHVLAIISNTSTYYNLHLHFILLFFLNNPFFLSWLSSSKILYQPHLVIHQEKLQQVNNQIIYLRKMATSYHSWQHFHRHPRIGWDQTLQGPSTPVGPCASWLKVSWWWYPWGLRTLLGMCPVMLRAPHLMGRRLHIAAAPSA